MVGGWSGGGGPPMGNHENGVLEGRISTTASPLGNRKGYHFFFCGFKKLKKKMVLGFLHFQKQNKFWAKETKVKMVGGWRGGGGAAHGYTQHSDLESCNSTTDLTLEKQHGMHISSPVILHMKQTPPLQTSASEIVASTGTVNN